tara:strand:+ start:1413 stop:2204 length:792 start_codon:yes stop_codon:yes gene_type:complete
MSDVTQDLLFTELETKQDTLLPLKHGLYSSGEGSDGDMCVCINNGKKVFGVKLQGEWNYTELTLEFDTIDKNVIHEEINNDFVSLLTRYSANITRILNRRTPRTYTFPFYARSFTDSGSGDTYIGSAVIVPGIQDQSLMDRIISGTATATLGNPNAYSVVPFRCKLKTVIITARHISHSTDDRSSTTLGLTGNAYNTSLSTLGTDNKTLTATVADIFTRYSDENFSSIIIPQFGHFDMVIAVNNPTNRKVASLNGIMVFEEVI